MNIQRILSPVSHKNDDMIDNQNYLKTQRKGKQNLNLKRQGVVFDLESHLCPQMSRVPQNTPTSTVR